MKNEPLKILALKPGSKYLGVAIFKGTELVHWAIKKLKSAGMSGEEVVVRARNIVKRLIDDYRPGLMAIEMPSLRQSQNSPYLESMVAGIKELGRSKLKKVYTFSALKVRRYICQEEKATRMNVEKTIATRYYPWLYQRYTKDKLKDLKGHWWKRKYHSTLFDAVALGLYCYQRIKQRKLPSPECPSPP